MSVIVHTILLDKFTSSAIQSWPDPENHTWIGIGDRNSPCDYQFQRPLDPKTIEDIITQHKVWVMHRYIPELSGLISTSKTSKIPVIIQTWGPDYLQYNLFTKHLLPRTRKFIQRNTTQSQRIKAVRNEIYWHIKRVKQRQGFKDAHAILFGTPEERINFTSKYSHGGNKRLFYNHEAPKKPININPRMLILGHCSDPSMNHLDALHHLKNQDYQIQRILIPLSYGHGPIEYKKFIIKQANHLFGKKVNILDTFMPRRKYESKIGSYGTFVHFGLRQQALGTCYNTYLKGGQVIFYPDSINERYFKRILNPHLNSLNPISLTQNTTDYSHDILQHIQNTQAQTQSWIRELAMLGHQ